MKHLLRTSLLTALLFCLALPHAGAGLNTYAFSQSSGTYTALTTTNILTTAHEYHIALPFTFRVDTLASDSLWINVDGYAGLKKNSFVSLNVLPLSDNLVYTGVMAPFGTALYVGTSTTPTGAIRYATSGTAPNRIFTVDWQNKATYYTYTVSFQLQMHEGSNVVDFVYGSIPTTSTSNSLTTQVGLRVIDTNMLNGSVINRTNVGVPGNSWTATVPGTTSKDLCYILPSLTPPAKPASGLTFTWTPAPSCTASAGAGILPDSFTVCYASRVSLVPTGTRDSLTYQWQSSADNGLTWTNYNGGAGGNYLTAISAPVTATILYRQQATCLKTSTVSYTNATKLKTLPAVSAPYFEGFESIPAGQGLPSCMTVAPGTIANVQTGVPHYGTKAVSYNNVRGWVITPGINLLAGKTYRFSHWYQAVASTPDTVRMAIGTYPQQDSMSASTIYMDVLPRRDNNYKRASFTFTVPASGRYFAGIRWSAGSIYNLIDDLELIEVPNQDVAIDSFIYPLPTSQTCFSTTTPVTIRVRNAGQLPISNIPVYYSLNGTKYGPEIIAASIAPGNSVAYTFTQTANLTGIYTLYDFKAWAAMSGDGSANNDTAYPQSIRTDTVHTVPYTQTFNGINYLTDIKWFSVFNPSVNGVYTGYSYNNTSPYFFWYVNAIPTGDKDSVGTTPLSPIHANTFMTFDYRVVDGTGFIAHTLIPGDTLFVVATTNCGTTRDTLMRIHGGNQFHSDSFKTIPPLFLGTYAGNVIRIAFVVKKGGTSTATLANFLHLDNVSLSDLKLHDIGIVSLLPMGTIACSGVPIPAKVVIKNYGGFAATGFPIKLVLGSSSSPAINYTYTPTLNFNQSDTVSMGSFTPPAKGNYPVKIYTALSGDTSTANDTITTSIYVADTPSAPVFTSRTICAGDTVQLNAATNDSLAVFWYANLTSAVPVSTSSPYTVTPSATATYYGASRFTRKAHAGKPAYTSTFGPGFYNNFGLILDVQNDMTLDSMAMYPVGTGSVTVGIYSCAGCASPAAIGTYTYTFSSATGAKVMVPVQAFLPKGNGYLMEIISTGGLTDLKRDFPFSGYPLAALSAPLVVSSGWGNAQLQFDGYYYFYDFVTRSVACESARAPVTVTVNPRPLASFTGARSGATVAFKNFSTGGGTYLWKFGDGDTSTATAPVHTYPAAGTYSVTMVQTNGCGSDSLTLSINIIDLGVGGIAAISDVQLYPNPAQDRFTLSFNAGNSCTMRLKLYSSIGAEVLDEVRSVNAGPQSITGNVSRLPAGNYLLLLLVDGKQQSLPLTISAR